MFDILDLDTLFAFNRQLAEDSVIRPRRADEIYHLAVGTDSTAE